MKNVVCWIFFSANYELLEMCAQWCSTGVQKVSLRLKRAHYKSWDSFVSTLKRTLSKCWIWKGLIGGRGSLKCHGFKFLFLVYLWVSSPPSVPYRGAKKSSYLAVRFSFLTKDHFLYKIVWKPTTNISNIAVKFANSVYLSKILL